MGLGLGLGGWVGGWVDVFCVRVLVRVKVISVPVRQTLGLGLGKRIVHTQAHRRTHTCIQVHLALAKQ